MNELRDANGIMPTDLSTKQVEKFDGTNDKGQCEGDVFHIVICGIHPARAFVDECHRKTDVGISWWRFTLANRRRISSC